MADRTRRNRGPLRWATVVAVVAVLVAGVGGALAVRAVERSDDADRREVAIGDVVARVDQVRADALAAGVAGPSVVDRWGGFSPGAFAALAQPLAERSDASLVTWVEVVPDAERARWEAQWGSPIVGAQPGVADAVPVAPKERYLVLTGIHPDAPWYAPLRGWDVSTQPVFANTAARAVEVGAPQASPPFEFPTGGRGFLLVVPVTRADASTAGFVSPFYLAEEVLEGVTESVPAGGAVRIADGDGVLLASGDGSGPTSSREVEVLGRTWTVSVQAPMASADWPWVLFAAALLAALVGVVLWRSDRTASARERLLQAEREARAQADAAQAALATSDARFRALLAAITKIVFIADRDGAMLPSESWERFTGQAEADYVGEAQGGFDAVHPDDRERLKSAWDAALASGERLDTTYRLRRADGEHRRVTVAAIPMPGPDGTAHEWVGAIADVEDRLRAEEQAQAISRNAARLAGAATVGEVAEATLADLEAVGVTMGAVRLLRDGVVEVVAVHGVDLAAFRGYSGIPLDEDPTPSGEAMRTGRTVVVDDDPELDQRFPGAVPLRDGVGARTVVAIPLRTAEGQVVGSLTVASATARWLTDDLRRLLVGMAEQTGLAIERARLQTKVAEGSKRASFLAALAEALERRVSVRARAEQAVELIGERWDVVAAVCLLDEVDELQVVAASSPWADVDPADLVTPADGDVVLGTDVPGTVRTRPDGGYRLVLPLVARGRELGVLVVDTGGQPGAVAGMDASLARDTGARLAVALDNARMYEHERDVSHALQVGLLSGSLQQVDGVLLSTSYRPGTEALEVGGDWYDVFDLDGGRVALVVGDVVGHGLEAAVAMGQLRGAVRALAPGCGPAALLDRLDTFVAGLPLASMATVAYAVLDPATGALRYACAGHPPPLLVTAGGARLLWDGRSTPLGCTFGDVRGEAELRLAPGDAVVLYTDGLVERRGEPIDDAFGRLADAAAGIEPFDGAYAEHLADRLLGSRVHDDDACVLALQRAPAARQFSHPLVAEPSAIAGLRRRLAPWLEAEGVDAETNQAVLLAVSEAAANSLEHGYGFDGRGVTTVDAVIAGGALRITVRDEGRWKEPRSGTDRGRGTPIMQTLMDELVVEPGPSGTTVTMCLVLGTAVQV